MKELKEIEKILKESSKRTISLPCNNVRQLIGAFTVSIKNVEEQEIHYAFHYLLTLNAPDLTDITYVMRKLITKTPQNSISARIAKRVINIIE